MTRCRIKNWESLQHYKHRQPPWIKLHHDMLDDFEFNLLPVASRAMLPMLWLIASEDENGILNCAVDFIAYRLRQPLAQAAEGIGPLIERGYLIPTGDASILLATCKQLASNLLADCKQVAMPETEAEAETEKRQTPSGVNHRAEPERAQTKAQREAAILRGFGEFWVEYPRKVARRAAERAWRKLLPSGELTALIVAAVKRHRKSADWRRDRGQFVPYPATWLNARRWEDESAAEGEGAERTLAL